jgi:glycosidase
MLAPELAVEVVAPRRSCQTELRYDPGRSVTTVGVAGEWNGWDPASSPMQADPQGGWVARLDLPAGSWAYKFVVDGSDWRFDPSHPYRKYVANAENSVVEVGDCKAPRLSFVRLDRAPASGTAHLEVQYLDGSEGGGFDPSRLEVTLDDLPLRGVTVSPTGLITVEATGLPRDKHRFVLNAADRRGRAVEAPLYVPFWIEDEPFDYRDGLLYFVFTDRFRNGDPANDAPTAGVDPRANYQGGDFQGVLDAIEEGWFDRLGVRTLWLSPPNANPDGGMVGTGGHLYTGYHGYWPSSGRDPQRRFGDLALLKRLVRAAHRRGIRVVVDAVLNHVHSEHPLWQQHRGDGWFYGDGTCVCQDGGCGDWKVHALDCWFTSYMPDVNYANYAALETMIDDALFWVRELDLDGFRVDAVKHFLHAATSRLRGKLRDEFEHGQPLFYLVGETFDGDRNLINSYVGPDLLHAQFDFPVYFTVRDALGYGSTTMRSLDAAVRDSETVFGTAPMSPFLGNHDVPRFLTIAAGQLWNDAQAQAWQAPPPAPAAEAPYQKLRLAQTFIATQNGVPLLYYGDEVGLPGAADPDNRRFMKWSALSAFEEATLEHSRRLGRARAELVALRRGGRATLWVDDDVYVYARVSGSQVVVVALNRAAAARGPDVPVPPGIPLPDGTVLTDRLSGLTCTVAGGKLPVRLSSYQSQILVP